MTKSKRQAQYEDINSDLEGALKKLQELASTDPYLTDAQAFLTQAIACLGKQVTVEFGKSETTPKPEGAKTKAKAT
jgi:hypothetical protein